MPTHIENWLAAHVDEFISAHALAVGASEVFDIAMDDELDNAALAAWEHSFFPETV